VEAGGADMAIVSPSAASGLGVSPDPQELQKRLVSDNSAEQDGHLIMMQSSQNRNTSVPLANSASQVHRRKRTNNQALRLASGLP